MTDKSFKAMKNSEKRMLSNHKPVHMQEALCTGNRTLLASFLSHSTSRCNFRHFLHGATRNFCCNFSTSDLNTWLIRVNRLSMADQNFNTHAIRLEHELPLTLFRFLGYAEANVMVSKCAKWKTLNIYRGKGGIIKANLKQEKEQK